MRTNGRDAPREIGPMSGILLVAGSMLGVGIFLSPPIVAAATGSLPGYLASWIAGGGLAFAGATVYAELGASFPEAGGDYTFLREGLGRRVGVAAGWVLWLGVFAGSIAALSSALFEYQVPVLLRWAGWPPLESLSLPLPAPLPTPSARTLGPPLIIATLTLLNASGLRPSLGALGVLTGGPLLLFAGTAIYALLTTPGAQAAVATPEEGPAIGLLAFGQAYLAVYFAYSGWNAVAYVGGEVRAPDRTLPLSLFVGTAAITLLYVLLCGAFAAQLGVAGLAASGEAGTALARALFGRMGEVASASLIAAALLGSLHATVLTGARIVYAMARDGAFPSGLAKLGQRNGMPTRALGWQALVAVALVSSGGFEILLSTTSLAMQLLGGLVALAFFRLRRTRPERPRPYRATGYPYVPGLYLGSTAIVLVASSAHAAVETAREGISASLPLWGLALFALALFLARR